MHRHFTATAIVIDSHKRTLLLWHNKFQKWMPPGGHMEADEIPEEAALRECKEETGLDIEIVSLENPDFFANQPFEGRMLKMPYTLLLENIPEHKVKGEPAHQHIDFVYLARPLDENQVLSLQEAEGSDLKWFTYEEVLALPETNLFRNLREFLRHVLSADTQIK